MQYVMPTQLGAETCETISISHTITTPLALVHMKEEYAVTEEVDWSGVDQSSTSKEMYEVLKCTIKPLYLVYCILF